MSTTATTPNISANPFDTPLPSEVSEHQQASNAAVASGGNPFDTPLPSEAPANQKQSNPTPTQDDDVFKVGGFGDQIPTSLTGVTKVAGDHAKTLAAAGITAGGIALAPEVAELAMKHLAGNVLPGMEYQAARSALIQALPKVAQFADTMGKLGVGAGGLTYLLKTFMGDGKK